MLKRASCASVKSWLRQMTGRSSNLKDDLDKQLNKKITNTVDYKTRKLV